MRILMIWLTVLACGLVLVTPAAAFTINSDTVWPAGTYSINDNLIILNDATLTIEEGATVWFAPDTYLWVQAGALDATGVTFTCADEFNEWRGIWIFGSDSRSRLVNCTIEHSKGYSESVPAMVYLYGDAVAPGSTIEGCLIGNGTAGQGIHVAGGASPRILTNSFSRFGDAAVCLQSTQTAMVTGNTFDSNAVGVHINYGGNSAPTVTGNTYLNNTEADVRVTGTIYETVAWNEDPGTVYHLAPGTGGLIIEENGHLTTTDGIIVQVDPDKVIWVQTGGVLEAIGATFTAADETSQWDGIWFYSGDSRSRLENCIIERIKGRSTDGYAMVRVQGGVADSYPSIIGCTIGNGDALRGIYVAGASPQIFNNSLSGFGDAAVSLQSTQAATVTGNTFDSNAAGVHINYGGNSAPTVTGNTYLNNTEADVRVTGTIYETVAWNEDPGTVYHLAPGTGGLIIEENGHLTTTDGIIVQVDPDKVIWVQTGGVLEATGATFTAADETSQWDGIWFYSGDSRSLLENCIIERIKGRSTDGYAMVRVQGGVADSYPSIIGCTIGNGDALRGIYVAGASPRILGNTIYAFSDYGIYITGPSAPLLAGNTITGNTRGIGAFTQSESVVSRVNDIEGNTEYGSFTGESYTYLVADARYNWWGSPTGPYDPTGNPSGTGDQVSSKVDYTPWIGSIADTEGDGMWDEWEVQNFTDTFTATDISDFDEDGLLDTAEFLQGTDPKNCDSDGDGVFDGLEVQCFLNPLLAGDFGLDRDNDGYSDLRELISGTDQWDITDTPEIIADREPQPSGDGDVDGKDLTAFIAEIGLYYCSTCQFDLDHDGDVDRADLFLLSEDFGRRGNPI